MHIEEGVECGSRLTGAASCGTMLGKMPASPSFRQPRFQRSWFDSALGMSLIQATQRQATPLLTSHIGVRGLFLRPTANVSPLLSGNMLQATVSLHQGSDVLDGDVRCLEGNLPFESETMSLVYLLHTLDSAIDPHSLIAECARVLQPEGVMFVVSLSTTSLWRLRWSGRALRPLSEQATRRLLRDRGLEVDYGVGLGPIWPYMAEAMSRHEHQPASRWVPDPLRASLLLMARKRRAGMTPILMRKSSVAMGSHAHAG